MNSLRSRLILGSSLIAVVPLALAMFFMAGSLERTVRSQATARLDVALGGLRGQLAEEGEQIARRLEILASDPLLRRLYLVKPSGSRELSEYVAERQFLLGLDFLRVADTSGTEIADGSMFSAAPPDEPQAWPIDAPVTTPRLVERADGTAGMALIAAAPILYDQQPAGVLQGGLVLDQDFVERLARDTGMKLILIDARNRVVSSTLPAFDSTRTIPVTVARITLADTAYVARRFPLDESSQNGASIAGLISLTESERTIATMRTTAVALGLIGLAVAAVLGFLWSSQISRPVERIAEFSERLARGNWDEPLELKSVRELETLVEALDRMRIDLTRYRDRLVVSERHAAWGEMARTVAHEVKNPLTPIAIAVADLKRSYDQQRPEFPAILDEAVRTILEEIETLKRLLREFAELGRTPPLELARSSAGTLLADLEALYRNDVAEGRLVFLRPDREIALTADASQLRQALINLIKNGLEAIGDSGSVTLSTTDTGAGVELVVADTGPGLPPERHARPFAPGFTTKRHGSGLGLTIVERIVNDHQGTITVETGPRGTTFRLELLRDAQPPRS